MFSDCGLWSEITFDMALVVKSWFLIAGEFC